MELARQIAEFTNKGAIELEESDRIALLQATNKLTEALESPPEKLVRWCMVRG